MKITTRDKYPYLKLLKNYELKTLFNEAKEILKYRGLIKYDIDTSEPYVELINKTKKIPKQSRHSFKIKNDGIRIIKSPETCTLQPNKLKHYILYFLNEDWKFLFPNADNIEKKYYVYYHTDITKKSLNYNLDGQSVSFKGNPFYIGKGTGNRYKNLNQRATSHILRIKNMIKSGIDKDRIFYIFKNDLTELEALEMEAKLICFFGCQIEIEKKVNYFYGGSGGLLINSDVSKRPKWVSIIIERLKNKYIRSNSRENNLITGN